MVGPGADAGECEAHHPGHHHGDIQQACELLDHHDGAGEGSDGDGVAQPGAGKRGEAQEEQLHPAARLLWVDRCSEASRLSCLDDDEDISSMNGYSSTPPSWTNNKMAEGMSLTF